MKRKVIETEDGSNTILIESWGESFHSIHGAIQEAQHVYMNNGLRFVFEKRKSNIQILEMGFGTGLNCLMTLIEADFLNVAINYTGVEGFPLNNEEWQALNYKDFFDPKYDQIFNQIHLSDWNKHQGISNSFNLKKMNMMFDEIEFEDEFDLVYFDVFGFQYQPELWSEEIFIKVKKAMKSEGVLVTYACKGQVNRILKNLGFKIEKLAGPPGKREMIRAYLTS